MDFFFHLFFFFFFFWGSPVAFGGFFFNYSRGPIRAVAVYLFPKPSNARFEPHLQPIPQLMETLDPWPTERGQGLNPQPHGSWSDLFPLHHDRNSKWIILNSCIYLCYCTSKSTSPMELLPECKDLKKFLNLEDFCIL